MLKREITYENFNGETVSEVFYFNLSKAELIELEVEYEKGLSAYLDDIIKTEDRKKVVETFKKLVLLAYGEKSEDGKHFVKNDQIRENFSHTAAYQHLFMELSLDEDAAANWVKGVLPRDLTDSIKEGVAEALGTGNVLTSPTDTPTT